MTAGLSRGAAALNPPMMGSNFLSCTHRFMLDESHPASAQGGHG